MSVQTPNRIVTVSGTLAMLFSLAISPTFAQPDVGTLRVTIRDEQSGEIVPAMIGITSLADNT